MDKNIHSTEKSTHEEHAITEKQMGDYKQIYQQQTILKKKQYLSAIKEHNTTLVNRIKEFNERVNNEVNSIVKKIVPKKRMIIPKYEEIQTKALKQKFQELEKYKKQVQTKRSSTDSLQFLLTVKKKFEIKLNELNKEIFAQRKQISKLKKIKDKSSKIESVEKNQLAKIGDLDIYSEEIQQLRMKIRLKNDNLRAKKDQFLSIYKQNKSNKSIVIESLPKEQQVKQEDPQLVKLKQEYEALGKRVQILKLKRLNLANQVKSNSDNVKKLQKLKSKYALMSKMTA